MQATLFDIVDRFKPFVKSKTQSIKAQFQWRFEWHVPFINWRMVPTCFIYLELFVVGKSTIYLILCEVVYAINKVFKSLISWPNGNEMQIIMAYFKTWCGLAFVQGAIDGTHISIAKPLGPFAKDYYLHKTSEYNMVAQVVVDCKTRFTDCLLTFLVMLIRVLKRSIGMLNIMVVFIMSKLM